MADLIMKKLLLLLFVVVLLNACNIFKYSSEFKHAKANNEIEKNNDTTTALLIRTVGVF